MVYWNTTESMMGLVGGFIIAFVTSANLGIYGRITGLSGIFHGVTIFPKEGMYWKLSYFGGMIFMSSLIWLIFQFDTLGGSTVRFFEHPVIFTSSLDIVGWFIGGFLVGFGSKMQNGCTSGHGVCGLPRLSVRSWVAVPVFLASGIACATARYYWEILYRTQAQEMVSADYQVYTTSVAIFLCVCIFLFVLVQTIRKKKSVIEQVVSLFLGMGFSFALLLSGMGQRSKVISFLTMSEIWDPTLMFVLGGAVGANFLTFNYLIRIRKKTLLGTKISIPNKTEIDWKLIFGAICFGFGWGATGICPGPAMINMAIYIPHVLLCYMPALVAGQIAWLFGEKGIEKLKQKRKEENERKKVTAEAGMENGNQGNEERTPGAKQRQENISAATMQPVGNLENESGEKMEIKDQGAKDSESGGEGLPILNKESTVEPSPQKELMN